MFDRGGLVLRFASFIPEPGGKRYIFKVRWVRLPHVSSATDYIPDYFGESFYALRQIKDTSKIPYLPVKLFIFRSNEGAIGKGVEKGE